MTNNTDPAGLSSSPQYRVVADRDKGDDPTWHDVHVGDRYIGIATERAYEDDPLVRIERPVPTTGLPDPMRLTDAEADSFHEAMHAPHLPTREQIAEALDGLQLWTGVSSAPLVLDKTLSAQIAYALIQNGADRG